MTTAAQMELFQTVAESLPGGVYVLQDGRVLFANQELARILGDDSPTGLQGRDLFRDVYPDPPTADLFRRVHGQLLQGECDRVSWGQPCQRRDGTPFWLEVEARSVRVGDRPAVLATVHDATDCKMISEAMQASQGTLHGLLDAMEDRVYLVDEDFKVLYANRKMLETTYGDVNSQPCYVVCRGLDTPCADCSKDEVFDTDGPVYREYRDDHSGAWYSVIELPVRVPGVDKRVKLGVRRDITLRKEAEDRIRALTHRLLSTQEAERKRLSRDLHDDLGQQLNAIKIGLDTLAEDLEHTSEEFADQARHLCRMLQGSVESVRNLSGGLRPSSLERLGLVRAVAEHCESVAAVHGLPVEFRTAGMDGLDLDEDTAINLYRIAQEALHNAVKHARAAAVTVRLVASYPTVRLKVQDDGAGFDPAGVTPSGHDGTRLGLVGMRERAEWLGGSFLADSRPGRGTRIVVEVPLTSAENGRETSAA